MGILDFLIAVLLLAFAVVLVVFIAGSVFKPLFSFLRELKEKVIIDKAIARLEKVEKFRNEDNFNASLQELRKAFLYDIFQTERSLSTLKEHHQNALSRCIAAAEQLGGRLENLGVVEKVLIERSEILVLYTKALSSYQSIRQRREGKKMPSWSKNEFETRIAQIKGELSRNQKTLDEELNKLFMFLKNRSQENIIYH